MQRDVKIGIAIGVLLILLVAVFWWSRQDAAPQAPPEEEDVSAAELPPTQDPVAPEHGSPYLSESPEVAAEPPAGGSVGPSASAVNPRAALEGAAAPPAVEPPRTGPTTPLTPPAAAPKFHTIKTGDTLSAVSYTHLRAHET